MSHQLALFDCRSFPQYILRVFSRCDIILIYLHLRLALGRQPLQSIEPLDFFFEFHPHTKLVHAELVDDLEEFVYEFFLAYVFVLAVPVSRFRAGIVDVLGIRAVLE